MGVASPKAASTDSLARAIQFSLKEKAAREALTEAEYRGLGVSAYTQYDITSMSLLLRITWHDPLDKKVSRCIDHRIDERTAQDLGLMACEVENIVKNLSLRGELFFFRLAKHFPKHLKKVKCDGQGAVEVEFKNGHTLTIPEEQVDSPDFLAKCGMIYDL